MAKYIRQEIIDLNNTGEKQVYYRMKSATHFTHEQFMEWMRSADPSVTRHIEAAISHLTHQLAVALAHGHSVKINGLGTFRAAVGLKKKQEPDKIVDGMPQHNAQNLKVTGVNFRVDKEFVSDINANCKLESGGTQRIRRQKYTSEDRHARALDYLDKNGTMNIAQYASLNGLSRTVATLELQKLRNNAESGIDYIGRGTHKLYVRRKE